MKLRLEQILSAISDNVLHWGEWPDDDWGEIKADDGTIWDMNMYLDHENGVETPRVVIYPTEEKDGHRYTITTQGCVILAVMEDGLN
jgi:hypothetical protein